MDTGDKITYSAGAQHSAERIDQVGSLAGVTLPSPQDDEPQSTKERLKEFGRSARSTTKNLLHIDDTKQQVLHGPTVSTHAVENDAGLNPSKVLDTEVSNAQNIKNKMPIPHSMSELKEMIKHPRSTGQNHAAEVLAVSENPHLKGNEDDDLVQAHGELIDAHENLKGIERDGRKDSAAEEQSVLLQGKIDKLEQDREEKRTAWVSSRYVHSARVLSSQQYKFPLLSSCRWVDESCEPQGAQWSQWFEQLRTFLRHIPQPTLKQQKLDQGEELETDTYDQDIILQETERILIASSPLQRWISSLRKMRAWHTPAQTAFWLSLWLGIWACNRVFTFLYCYAIYRALQTRTDFDRREGLKDAQARAADEDEMNNTFGEMITSFGSSKWLQPTMEMVGPVIQNVMRGTADWLEIMAEYPEWKTPRATRSVVAVMLTAIVLSQLLSTEFWFRVSTLVSILVFFVDVPLVARYPKYRQVLLPIHWILWEVPTKTETSFGYLRQQAQAIRLDLELNASQRPDEAATDAGLFATECVWKDITGTMVLTPTHMRFMRSFPRQEIWSRNYHDLVELSKGEGRTSPFHGTAHLAEMHFSDGSVEKVEHLKKNDTLFNVIFAFSGLQWRQK